MLWNRSWKRFFGRKAIKSALLLRLPCSLINLSPFHYKGHAYAKKEQNSPRCRWFTSIFGRKNVSCRFEQVALRDGARDKHRFCNCSRPPYCINKLSMFEHFHDQPKETFVMVWDSAKKSIFSARCFRCCDGNLSCAIYLNFYYVKTAYPREKYGLTRLNLHSTWNGYENEEINVNLVTWSLSKGVRRVF